MSPAQISDGPTSIRIYCGPPKHHGNPLVFIDSFETDFKSLVLDPNNIESINVLKDTVATRLYGARAKHGVILIKTKLNTKFYKVTDFVNPRVNLNSSVSAIELNGILLSDFKTIIIG
jgi:TonB-dependent SusC/RagA subfamily outer membrane receptor